jgi:phosphoglycolate phosphatase-like HAD superfamily hydrolase
MTATLKKLGYPANEVVMIGDTPYDIEAARKVGVGTIAFRCGGWHDADLGGALAVYDGPADLLAHYDTSPLGKQGG